MTERDSTRREITSCLQYTEEGTDLPFALNWLQPSSLQEKQHNSFAQQLCSEV